MKIKMLTIGLAGLLVSGCLGNADPKPKSVSIEANKTVPVQGGAKVVSKVATVPVEKAEALPLFQIYGELAPVGYVDSANPITEKYGFRVERVAGCEVDSSESNSVDSNNKKSLEAMNEKYGKDWRKKFFDATKLKLSFPM